MPTNDEPLRFRRVKTADEIAQVARLAREIWREHYVPIIGVEQVDYMLEKFQSEPAIAGQIAESCEYYVLIHRGSPAGYLAVAPDADRHTLLLSKLYTRRQDRGTGLGKAMLRFVEDLCRQRELDTVRLTVNRHNSRSIAWYSRMGFRNAGPIVQDISGGFVMDDFRMEKSVG